MRNRLECEHARLGVGAWVVLGYALAFGCTAGDAPQETTLVAGVVSCGDVPLQQHRDVVLFDPANAERFLDETRVVNIQVGKIPDDADTAILYVEAEHANYPGEAMIRVNGYPVVRGWGTEPSAIRKKCIGIRVPVGYWNVGRNRLAFRYTDKRGRGFRVLRSGVAFSTTNPVADVTPGRRGVQGPTELPSKRSFRGQEPAVVAKRPPGHTNDDQVIADAIYTGRPIFFPDRTYRVTKRIKLRNHAFGRGKIISSNRVVFAPCDPKEPLPDHIPPCKRPTGLTIWGLDVTSTYCAVGSPCADNHAAPILIQADDMNDLTVRDCRLTNVMIRHPNNKLRKRYRLKVLRNYIRADFRRFNPKTQNDIITARGIDGVEIRGNVIRTIRAHRIIKLGDTLGNPSPPKGRGAYITRFNTRNVDVVDNLIVAAHGKQVVDMFNGTQNALFEHNTIVAAGYVSVMNHKTSSFTTYRQNTRILNNVIETTGKALVFQGSWGALRPVVPSGYQDIAVRGNNIVGTALETVEDAPGSKQEIVQPYTAGHELVSIRFFHYVDVRQNRLESAVIGRGANVRIARAAVISANKVALFRGNKVVAGGLRHDQPRYNQQTLRFHGKEQRISVTDNTFFDGYGDDYKAVIYLSRVGVANTRVSIKRNTLTQETGPKMRAPVVVVNSRLALLTAEDNNATNVRAHNRRVLLVGTNRMPEPVEDNNLW